MKRSLPTERLILMAVALVLVVAAVVLTAPFVAWGKVMSGPEGPAWVQAVGSVLALGVTGWAAVHQTSRASRLEGKRTADRLRSRARLLSTATDACRAFLDQHRARTPGGSGGGLVHMFGGAAVIAFDYADEVNPTEMPTEQAVVALLTWIEQAKTLRDILELSLGLEQWMNERQQQAFRDALQVAASAAGNLYAEAARLEAE